MASKPEMKIMESFRHHASQSEMKTLRDEITKRITSRGIFVWGKRAFTLYSCYLDLIEML